MSPIRKRLLKNERHTRCLMKVPYISWATAMKAFIRLQKKTPIFNFALRIYKCPFKEHYHVGHRTRTPMFEILPAIARENAN